jgi:hypothetical protein
MKKIILGVATSCLFVGTVLADSTNIGLKLSYGNLDADGTNTTNSSSGGSGGTALNSSGSMNLPLASIFLEREIELSELNIALGIDLVPMSASTKLDGGTGTDANVEVGNQFTAYIQPSKTLGNDMAVFVKLGYSRADVDVTDITRQSTTAGTASTDTSASKTLEGPMIGLGFEKSNITKFVRLEVTHTDYDKISYTNSNSKVLTADADLTAISLSIGKKF